jgi:NADH:ubiquinone oxidoreductase subunit F (NADH-binding)
MVSFPVSPVSPVSTVSGLVFLETCDSVVPCRQVTDSQLEQIQQRGEKKCESDLRQLFQVAQQL